MPTSYQFTPRIPAAPHPTPGSDYKLPHVKSTRPPAQNPYDKFTQPEFDAWIGGITGALKRALGQEEEEEQPKPDKRDPSNFVHTQPNVFDDASELSDDHIEDSFAEVKARRAVGKGKARDPREGPGFGKGDSSNPIDLVSSDEEDAEEVELSIVVPESDDEDDLGAYSEEEEYSWERGQASSPLAPSPPPKISKSNRDDREEEEYGSEDEEEKPYEEGGQYDEYDDDEYYDEDEEDEDHPQASHAEVIDLSSDNDEIEDDVSEGEQPPRKIRKVSPQRRADGESEPDGEGELDEDPEGEQAGGETSWAGSSGRVQGERERSHSPEVIDLDSGEEGHSDEEEVAEYEDVSSYQQVTKISSTRYDDQQGDNDGFFDEEDELDEGDGEEYDGEREEKSRDDGVGASQIPLSHDPMSSIHPQHDGHEHPEVVNDDDDEIQEVQPMEDDTSFPPKRSVSPFESNIPEIPDPWSGPRTYAEDYYSGGDVQIPLGETVDANHLGPNDDDLTADLAVTGNLGDSVVQPSDENTAFPPSEDLQTSVDISDPWRGPQLYAEDFYSGGPVQQHGGLATAQYLGPTDVDNVNDLIHNVMTEEKEEKEDEEMQPHEADTSFPQGDEETEGMVDIADPWLGPQTYAEDYYSGGDVRTLPGVPIDPALLSGTGDVEDDIDNFLTPGVLTPSQTNATKDLSEGDEENEIIAPSTERHAPSPLTRRNMSIPEDADIIAIEDSDEEKEQKQENPVMQEQDELEGEDDEDDDISLQYPDFDEVHHPLDIGEEHELDISAGSIVPPLQVSEEEEDTGALDRQFEEEGGEWLDLEEQPLDADISVTLGHVEEQEEEEEAEESKDQNLPEVVLSDEPQEKPISIDDEPEATTEPSSQTVESDSLAIPYAEEEFIVTTAADSDTQITSGTVLVQAQEGPADDTEGDVEMQFTLQDRNTATDESLAEDSSMMDVEPVIDDNAAETTVSVEQEAPGNPAVSIGQELDEDIVQPIPGAHDTGSQGLHTSSAPLPASPPGQLPTPPSEQNRHISLPPESYEEPTVESPPAEHTMESEQATSTADDVRLSGSETSQVIGNVEITEHTVVEVTEYDIVDGEFDHVGDDIDVRSAFTGEDVDDVHFSVEEPMTEGRLTQELPERQMSLGVISLPSEETPTLDHDEEMGTSQAISNNEPMDSEVSLSQVSHQEIEIAIESTMETVSQADVESTSEALQDKEEVVVPDPSVLDSIDQPISSNLSKAKTADPLSSEAMETRDTSPAPVPNIPDDSLEVDGPSPSMEPHVEATNESFNDQQTSTDHIQSSSNLAHPLEGDQSSHIANNTPTVDVFGTLPTASAIESRMGPEGQEMGAASLPYRAPSSSARVVLTRKPTDPVLMADPYPYCLSTPNVSPYTQQVSHPGESSIGTLASSSVQSDGGTTSSQMDQEVMKNEVGRDDSLLTPKFDLGSQSEISAAAVEEESFGEGVSKPTRKRKRATASAKSRKGSIVEPGDGTSPSAAESSQKGPAKEPKKRTRERKSSSLNKSASGSWKKKSTGNTPETTSYETIVVNPRLEEKAGETSQRATSVTSTQEESQANSSSALYRKIFPPGNASTVVSPAPSHRSFTSQPSPTINKPNILPHPNAASESLLHAHGQKRKAMLSQAMQHSIVSPRKMPQLSRFPSAPMIVSSQPSASTSVISPIETAKLSTVTPASSISPTEALPIAVPPKPVTPIPKANSMSARPTTRSTPVTRSHCRYHRISLPKEEGGPRVSFLVPGCSLNDKELMDEEEIVDHGDATVDDSRNMLKDVESLGFSLDLIGVLRQLVGLDILREQEIFYLPQPGEVVTRRIPLQKAASTIRAPGDSSSLAGSPGGYSGSIMASPGPNRPPPSASSWSESPSLSSLLRQPPIVAGSDQAETDKGYASTAPDPDTEFDSSDDEDEKHAKPSPSDPTTSKSKGKQARKFKLRKGIDLTYEPDGDHEEEESDTPASTRKRRKSVRGTKRNRDSDAVPNGNDGQEREAKKPKTEMDTPLEPSIPAQPQHPTI